VVSQTHEETAAHPCAGAVRAEGERLLVAVRVTPRAGRDAITCEGNRLRVRLHAPPVEGAANDALLALFAQCLRLPTRSITLERGATSREKLIEIAGLTLDEFFQRLGV
jgi:uncharacterized protein